MNKTTLHEVIVKPFLWFIVFLLLIFQVCLISEQAWKMSPTITEISHLGAIKYYWTMGYYDVFHANPPLTRIIAGVPWYMSNNTNDFGGDWSDYSINPADRCAYNIGLNKVLDLTNNDIRVLVYSARIFLLPLIVLGGYIGFKFASELYGSVSGLIFLMLWVGSPLITGWGATICTDVPAASMGIIAFYALWHWFKTPTPCKTVLNGVLLGLLPYTKLTWIIAFPVYVILYLYRRRLGDAPDVKKFVWIIVLSIATINVGYWFDGSFKLLKDYKFISGTLTGNYVEHGEEVIQDNRFAGSILGYIPIPLPYEFVRGIDTQKLDFERGFTSYAAGLVSNHGWWWYYAYGLFFKESFIVWIFVGLSFIRLLDYRDLDKWNDLFIIVPAVILFIFISANTGFSEHIRYAIPLLPFVFLFACRVGVADYGNCYFALGLACFVMLCIALCSHPMSYFNFVANKDKSQYLLGSNIDWGQSAYEIKNWCDTHVEARPRYINYTRTMSFKHMAVKDDGDFPEYERKPGWMIISVNDIYNEKYKWVQKETPVEILGGGSVFIYYLEP